MSLGSPKDMGWGWIKTPTPLDLEGNEEKSKAGLRRLTKKGFDAHRKTGCFAGRKTA